MPVRRFRLGEETNDELTGSTTAEIRVEMVVTLSKRMLEVTGEMVPRYSPYQMPVQIVRPE